jgi:DMSO/TMAO reductase YedYZ molybdopterin-dependent catalytic subunit
LEIPAITLEESRNCGGLNTMKSLRIGSGILLLTMVACLACNGWGDRTNYPVSGTLRVSGEVDTALAITTDKVKQMPAYQLNRVSMVKEKEHPDDKDELLNVADYEGILLRDLLEKAGMKYKRKWEPGVYVHVEGTKGEAVVFSFGEVFYSSIGRSILLAYKKGGKPIEFPKGCGELVVATDVRAGRSIPAVERITVRRVDVPLEAYKDKKGKIVRPPTKSFVITEMRSGKAVVMNLEDLTVLPTVVLPAAVMVGECEGFHGVFSFEGPELATVLRKEKLIDRETEHDRYVVISSEDGFSATFSFGELFNSRLNNNIIVAYRKNGELLDSREGFAVSAVGEDSTGGRSIKRIEKVEIY